MNVMNKETRIKELCDELDQANVAYRAGEPVMSDCEFDSLEDELRELDPSNEYFSKGVRDVRPVERERVLPHKMMSLDKIKRFDLLTEWVAKRTGEVDFSKVEVILTPKLDGVSAHVDATGAVTRGDGSTGRDFTPVFEHVQNSAKIRTTGVSCRGEIVMFRDAFDEYKTDHPDAKHPRNSVAGMVGGDYDFSKIRDYKKMIFVPYEVYDVSMSKSEQLELLSKCVDRNVLPCVKTTMDSLDMMLFCDLFDEWKKVFPIDGVVVDLCDKKYRSGELANGNPSYTVAFKSPLFATRKSVVVKDVELSVNRQNVVTPVIVFDPVEIDGVSVSRVNGINFRYLTDWGLAEGTRVEVVRSGEVIPKIVSVENVEIPFVDECENVKEYEKRYACALDERQKQYSWQIAIDNLPEVCPRCGSLLKWDATMVEKKCCNKRCEGASDARFVKFFELFGLEDFAEKSLLQLKRDLTLTSPYDLFFVPSSKISELTGWTSHSADVLVRKLQSLLHDCKVPFARFLHATGCFGELGEKTLQKIIDKLNGQWDHFSAIERLTDVKGLGEKTLQVYLRGVKTFIEESTRNNFLENFMYEYDTAYDVSSVVAIESNECAGVVVCVSGFRNDALKSKIEKAGGVLKDSWSSDTNVLLVKDTSKETGKTRKAKEKGVPVMTEKEFLSKYFES